MFAGRKKGSEQGAKKDTLLLPFKLQKVRQDCGKLIEFVLLWNI
jgi:hypothetical protein